MSNFYPIWFKLGLEMISFTPPNKTDKYKCVSVRLSVSLSFCQFVSLSDWQCQFCQFVTIPVRHCQFVTISSSLCQFVTHSMHSIIARDFGQSTLFVHALKNSRKNIKFIFHIGGRWIQIWGKQVGQGCQGCDLEHVWSLFALHF